MEANETLRVSGVLYEESLVIFKKFVIDFVRSLSNDDRAAFKYWCKDIIPQRKLDVNVAADDDIFNLIVSLQNDVKLSFTNMSFLKAFLKNIDSSELLEKLNYAEVRIATRIILKSYADVASTPSDGFQLGDVLCANIVRFLVATKEKNQELFSSALENLNQVKEDSTALTVVDGVIKGCEKSYSTVTAFLVILGEIFVTTSTEDQIHLLTPSVDCLAEWILKQGGLVSINVSSCSVCSSATP